MGGGNQPHVEDYEDRSVSISLSFLLVMIQKDSLLAVTNSTFSLSSLF